LKAQFDAASGDEAAQAPLIESLKSLAGSHSSNPSVQLTTSHVLVSAGQLKEALQCVFTGATLEHTLTALQIYIKIDRLDLARQQLALLKRSDEDSIVTQLASVYVHLASGSTGAADAVHAINSLSEQYGPSPFLLNIMASALMQQGDYIGAEQKLQECVKDYSECKVLPDTWINLICCTVHQNKSAAQYVQQLQQAYPKHAYCAGYERVVQAFDREAVKYKV
jgi:coatomer protein complex subunit epsilon